MTKILVTGGSGALGREIAKRLGHMSYSVPIMSRSPKQHAPQAFAALKWVQGHLETGQGLAQAVANVDIIVRAARDALHSRHIDVNDSCLPCCNYGGNFYAS